MFLDELIHLDGLHRQPLSCCFCRKTGSIRCSDCTGDALLCNSCCVRVHARLPFHVVQVSVDGRLFGAMVDDSVVKAWNGRHFIRTSLADLGMVVQLSHLDGSTCISPIHGPQDFMVLHTNSWHRVNLCYCKCSKVPDAGTHVQQLLRYQLYPATLTDPSTCTTFWLLEAYHALTLQSKITVYDYYHTLNNMMDNTGTNIKWVSSHPHQSLLSLIAACYRIVSNSSYA